MEVPAPPQPYPEEAPPPPPPVVETTPAAPLPSEPPPPPVEDKTKKALTVNAWARVTGRLQSFENPKKLDRLSEDGVFELHTDGAITNEIGVTANLTVGFGPTPVASGGTMNGTAGLLDLIGRFDIDDAFHIWLGRMLVPSDRANFSGDWFASPWYYAGTFALGAGGPWGGPTEGPNGRSDGATVWGQFGGGLFKYYVGAFDLYSPTKSPLWTARLNLSLINPEPGYYHSSTYYGSKDILAIAIGGQVQNNGSVGPAVVVAATPTTPGSMTVPTDDYTEFNADILFEKNLHKGGVITLEGAFYKYDGNYSLDYSYLAIASYLTPEKIGAGKLQPLVRVQQLKPQSGSSYSAVEAQLGYVIADYSARLALGYQYTKLQGTKGNAIYLGAQFLK